MYSLGFREKPVAFSCTMMMVESERITEEEPEAQAHQYDLH